MTNQVGAVWRFTRAVQKEVLTEGKRSTAVLDAFFEDVSLLETPREADDVASLEGIASPDASVTLAADDGEEILLANDKGLIKVARSRDVECWWVTTLLLKCTKEGTITATEATDILYDLVDEGTSLHPKVYAKVQRKLEELGD